MIEYWEKRGVLVNPWTFNTQEQKEFIKKMGIKTFVTNCFDEFCEEDLYDQDRTYGFAT